MTRNKKKLRRLERMAGAAKTGGRGSAARTLAVTGLLLGGLMAAPAQGADITTDTTLNTAYELNADTGLTAVYTVGAGGELTITSTGRLSGDAGSAFVVNDGKVTVQGGAAAATGGNVDVLRVDVSGGVVDLAGAASSWRDAAYLGGYDGLSVSGGTINMGANSELFIGRNNRSGAVMSLSGGVINMSGTAADHNAAHIWAGSPNLAASPSKDPDGPHYQPNKLLLSGATLNVGDGGATRRYGIINSQDTVMSAGAINVSNGILHIQANPWELEANGNANLWEKLDEVSQVNKNPTGLSTSDGAWVMTGGSLTVTNGKVQSVLKDFTVSGGTINVTNGYIDNEFTTVKGDATVNLTGSAGTWDAASYLAGYGNLTIGGNAVINMGANSELFSGQTTIAGVSNPYGALTITDRAVINMNGTGFTETMDGDVHNAAHIWAGSDDNNNRLIINGGTVNVLGDAVISSPSTLMSGGSVIVGGPAAGEKGGNLILQGKTGAKGQGGSILDPASGGVWVMTGGLFDASDGFVNSTLDTFEVAGGTFKADMLSVGRPLAGTVFNAIHGGFVVSGGTATTNDLIVDGQSLTVSGGSLTVANTLANSADDIEVSGTGLLALNADRVLTADGTALATGVNSIAVIENGVVSLASGGLTLTKAQAQATHDALVGSSGNWSVSGLTISDIADHATNTTLADGGKVQTLDPADTLIVGDSVAQDYAVTADVSGNTATLAASSRSGQLAVTGVVSGDVAITTAARTTVIGQGEGSPLVVGAGDARTHLVVPDGASLALGSAAVAGGGTLNGGITLGAAELNVVNGAFAVDGIVTGDNKSGTIALAGATLTSGSVDLTNQGGTSASDILLVGHDSTLITSGLQAGGDDAIFVGDEGGAGALLADNVRLGGALLAFDPAFGQAGDTSNASIGATRFASAIDGMVLTGRNSMVTIGSTDASWLRAEVDALQSQGRIVWGGTDANAATAALGIRGPQVLDGISGAGLIVDGAYTHAGLTGGTYTPPSANVHFGPDSLLVVDAPSLRGQAALSAVPVGASVAVAGTAKLMLSNAALGTYAILSGFEGSNPDTDLAAGGWDWDAGNLLASSYLQRLTLNNHLTNADPGLNNGGVTVTVSNLSAASVLPGISSGMANLVDSLYAQGLNDVASPNAGVRFVSRATDRAYMNLADSARSLESAAQPALAGGAPSVAFDAVAAATGAAAERTGISVPSFSRQAGMAAGDAGHSFSVWAMPLFRSTEIDGQKAGSFTYGVDSDLWGGAIGADVTNEGTRGRFRLGVALNVGGGDAKSTGDLYKTRNDFDFWGALAYAGWRHDNLGLSADLGYTAVSNDIKQDVASGLGMGGQFTSTVDADVYSLGLKAEYVIPTAFADITPSLGVRYNAYRQHGHNVDSALGTVFSLDKADMDTWTFPIGVKFSRDFVTTGWSIRPELSLAVIPAAGDTSLDSKASIPGLAVSPAGLTGHVFDDWTGEAGLGLSVARENVSLGLNYGFQGSENRTSHSVFGTLRLAF